MGENKKRNKLYAGIKTWAVDVAAIAGATAVGVGLAQWHVGLAWIWGGAVLMAAAILAARARVFTPVKQTTE